MIKKIYNMVFWVAFFFAVFAAGCRISVQMNLLDSDQSTVLSFVFCVLISWFVTLLLHHHLHRIPKEHNPQGKYHSFDCME